MKSDFKDDLEPYNHEFKTIYQRKNVEKNWVSKGLNYRIIGGS